MDTFNNNSFRCNKCGICCTKLNNNSLYSSLDRGDGICKYFDESDRNCSIYEKRPVLCRVEDSYNLFFSEKMTKEEYYHLNYKSCSELQKNELSK